MLIKQTATVPWFTSKLQNLALLQASNSVRQDEAVRRSGSSILALTERNLALFGLSSGSGHPLGDLPCSGLMHPARQHALCFPALFALPAWPGLACLLGWGQTAV